MVAALFGLPACLFLLACLLSCASSLAPVRSVFYIREHSFLNFDVRLAVIETHFDEDLYLLDDTQCAPFWPGVRDAPREFCACDYTGALGGACGEPFGGAPNCTCAGRGVAEYCQPSMPFSILQVGKSEIHTLEPLQFALFRLHVPSFDRGFRIVASTFIGAVDLSASWSHTLLFKPEEDVHHQHRMGEGYARMVVCPSAPSFRAGTLFIRTDAQSFTEYSLSVQALSGSESRPPATCTDADRVPTLETRLPLPLRCAVPGAYAYVDTAPSLFYYKIPDAVTCFPVSLTVYGRWGAALVATYNVSVITDFGNIFNGPLPGRHLPMYWAELGSFDLADNFDSAVLCPEAGKDRILYFGFPYSSPGGAQFSWVFHMDGARMPKVRVGDLPPQEFKIMTRGEFHLECPGLLPQLCNYALNANCIVAVSSLSTVHAVPFWPVPQLFVSKLAVTNFDMPGQYDARLHRVVVWLRNAVTTDVQLIPDSLIGQCRVRYMGKLVDKNLETFSGRVSLAARPPQPCRPEEFRQVRKEMVSILETISISRDARVVQAQCLKLDSLSFQDTWHSCYKEVLKLTNQMPSQDSKVEHCNAPDSHLDACCNAAIDSQCCLPAVPPRPQPALPVDKRRTRQCGLPDCAATTAQQFAKAVRAARSPVSACALPPGSRLDETLQSVTLLYSACKEEHLGLEGRGVSYWGRNGYDVLSQGGHPCVENSDCPGDTMCEPVTGRCSLAPADQARTFVQCVLARLGRQQPAVHQFLARQLGVPASASDRLHARALAHFSAPACVGKRDWAFPFRSRVVLQSKLAPCSLPIPCKGWAGLDVLSVMVPETCRAYCGGGGGWIVLPESEGACSGGAVCNWRDCEGLTPTQCAAMCMSPLPNSDHFCGVCNDEGRCLPVEGVTSEEECRLGVACVVGRRAVMVASLEACEELLSCSHTCGPLLPTCVPAGVVLSVCVDQGATHAGACAGTWQADASVCVISVNTDSSACELPYTHLSCAQLSVQACQGCAANSTNCPLLQAQAILGCRIAQRAAECTSKDACAASGRCSDEDFLIPPGEQGSGSPGLCRAAPFTSPQLPSIPGLECLLPLGLWTPEMCGLPLDSPGCAGKPVRTPSRSRDACLSYAACFHVDLQPAGGVFIHAITRKNATTCTACGEDWRPAYTWSPAKWVPGKPATPRWTQRAMITPYRFEPSFDFLAFSNALEEGARFSASFNLGLQAHCLYSRTLATLGPLVCDCLAGDTELDCYESLFLPGRSGSRADRSDDSESSDSSGSRSDSVDGAENHRIPLGTTIMCAGRATTFDLDPIVLTADASAVQSGCVEVAASVLVAYALRDDGQEPLSTSIIEWHDHSPYEVVYNSAGALVGQLLGHGIVLALNDTQTVVNVTLCVRPSALVIDSVGQYDVPDMAEVVGCTDGGTELRPRSMETLRGVAGLCVRVPRLASGTYLPVLRSAGWQSESRSHLTDTQRAAMFGIAGVYGVMLCFSVVALVFDTAVFRRLLLHSVLQVLVALHASLRVTYFALLGAAALNDDLLGYVLFELPFFLLFVIFTWEAILWFTLVWAGSAPAHIVLRRCIALHTAVNLFVLAVFVTVASLFWLLPQPTTDDCQALQREFTDTSRQHALSILYKVFILAMAVLVGGGFLALGGIMITKQAQLASTHKEQARLRILRTTVVCGVSFIALAIFLLVILVVGSPPLYIGCAVLLLTEVPQLCMTMKAVPGAVSLAVTKGRALPSFSQASPAKPLASQPDSNGQKASSASSANAS